MAAQPEPKLLPDGPLGDELHPQLYGTIVGLLIVASIVGAAWTAMPDPLPGLAMGSKVVLFTERAATIFAVLFLLALVVIRAVQGKLPQELSGRGVKYAESDAVDALRKDINDVLVAMNAQIDELANNQDVLTRAEPAADEAAGKGEEAVEEPAAKAGDAGTEPG